MNGQFCLIGKPESLEVKTSQKGNTYATFSIGAVKRVTTFSESAIAVLQQAPIEVLCNGTLKQKDGSGEYEGRVFLEWFADTVLLTKSAISTIHNDPKAGDDLPF